MVFESNLFFKDNVSDAAEIMGINDDIASGHYLSQAGQGNTRLVGNKIKGIKK